MKYLLLFLRFSYLKIYYFLMNLQTQPFLLTHLKISDSINIILNLLFINYLRSIFIIHSRFPLIINSHLYHLNSQNNLYYQYWKIIYHSKKAIIFYLFPWHLTEKDITHSLNAILNLNWKNQRSNVKIIINYLKYLCLTFFNFQVDNLHQTIMTLYLFIKINLKNSIIIRSKNQHSKQVKNMHYFYALIIIHSLSLNYLNFHPTLNLKKPFY